MKISLVYRDPGAPVDGIRDYTVQLARALSAHGADVAVELLDHNRVPHGVRDSDALIVQYNPFAYGRWGVAPWLPLGLGKVKHAQHGPVVALMVHEPYVPLVDWRRTLMGGWQRLQMVALRAASDVTFVSIEPWLSVLRRWRPGQAMFHLPVGSTVPDMRSERQAARAQLGLRDGVLAIASFGTDHPSRLTGHVGAAVTALHEAGHSVMLLNLGAGAPLPGGLPDGVRVESPGRLSPEALGRRLAAADLFLSPFTDGVSSRRGTFIAALQHSLPVVGTEGALTDPFIRQAAGACRLVPSTDRTAFARAVLELGERPHERAALGRNARSLFDRRFAWPVIAQQALAYLQMAGAGNGR